MFSCFYGTQRSIEQELSKDIRENSFGRESFCKQSEVVAYWFTDSLRRAFCKGYTSTMKQCPLIFSKLMSIGRVTD